MVVLQSAKLVTGLKTGRGLLFSGDQVGWSVIGTVPL